jgi:hypothetical protein
MRATIVRGLFYGAAAVAFVMAGQGHAFAAPAINTPEIDGSSVTTGLGILGAGVLLLRNRLSGK